MSSEIIPAPICACGELIIGDFPHCAACRVALRDASKAVLAELMAFVDECEEFSAFEHFIDAAVRYKYYGD